MGIEQVLQVGRPPTIIFFLRHYKLSACHCGAAFNKIERKNMKKLTLFIALSLTTLGCTGNPRISTSNLLPRDFKVYVKENIAINYPLPGLERRILPTINHYTKADGGYVAVYTKQKEGSVYGVGNGIYVIGQIRVQGKYIDRIFYPKGYKKGDNITKDDNILSLCHEYFPQFKHKVWIGGDTGGWYGNQGHSN